MRMVICSLLLSVWMGSSAFAETAAEPDLTTPSKADTATDASSNSATAPTAPFTMTTTAFLDQAPLPVLYTCDGKDISPEFAWTNPPKGTKAFAMIGADPEAPQGTWYHWVVSNLPATTTELTEGITQLPAGSVVLKNSWGKTQYNGPCPPKGTVHTYVFTLYALKDPIKDADSAEALMKAIQKNTLGSVTQTAVYTRWKN